MFVWEIPLYNSTELTRWTLNIFSLISLDYTSWWMDENKSLHYHLLLLLRARPNAEASHAQLSFAKQEANILKQQAKQLKKKITERSCSSTRWGSSLGSFCARKWAPTTAPAVQHAAKQPHRTSKRVFVATVRTLWWWFVSPVWTTTKSSVMDDSQQIMIDFTILRIENALLKKIEDFPKLMNKDNQCLRELWDLLIELCAAKTSGQLPGLSHLDAAHRVNPILTLSVSCWTFRESSQDLCCCRWTQQSLLG